MLALSATYPPQLAEQLTLYMRSPTLVRLNIDDPALLGWSIVGGVQLLSVLVLHQG